MLFMSIAFVLNCIGGEGNEKRVEMIVQFGSVGKIVGLCKMSCFQVLLVQIV